MKKSHFLILFTLITFISSFKKDRNDRETTSSNHQETLKLPNWVDGEKDTGWQETNIEINNGSAILCDLSIFFSELHYAGYPSTFNLTFWFNYADPNAGGEVLNHDLIGGIESSRFGYTEDYAFVAGKTAITNGVLIDNNPGGFTYDIHAETEYLDYRLHHCKIRLTRSI